MTLKYEEVRAQERVTEFLKELNFVAFVPGGSWATFSVGCFQWISASKGKLKKGKAKVRVGGSPMRSAQVFAKARAICDQFAVPSVPPSDGTS